MLQSLGNKMQGWPAIILLGVAVFAMSFFGIEGYFSSQTETFVAKVGKQEISQQQFQDRVNQLRQQARAQQGDQFDGSVFEKPENKQHILDQLVDEQILMQANDDLGMRVSDQSLREAIAAIPAFQVDGKFDPVTYSTLLAAQNKSPESFESEVRASMQTSLLPDAITASTIITDADLDRYLDIKLQRRDIRFFVLPKATASDTNVTDAQVETYYKAHLADFMSPEQVSVKFLEVNAANLKSDTPPTDQELKKRYQDESQRFVLPEQREVSHILIDVPKNATPAQQKAALDKAEKIAAEVTPANFAQIATKESEDLGSKLSGGDLGWLQKGVTNAAFDSALFAMQKGQISKPVLSDEGYHILWLRDVRSGQSKPFEQVRDQLVKEAQAADHDRLYNDVAGKLADLTAQNPGSLDPAAKALNLTIQDTPMFGHTGGAGIAANPKLVAAAFNDDVLTQGNNSSLIDLGNNDAVVIRLDKHAPAAARPVADVRDAIVQKILGDRVADAAKAKAESYVAQLVKGGDMATLAKRASVPLQTIDQSVRTQDGVPPAVLDAAFHAPHPLDGKPQFATAQVGDGVYAVLAVDKVQGGDLSKVAPDQRKELYREMMQVYGGVETRGFIDMLKSKTTIKIAKDRM